MSSFLKQPRAVWARRLACVIAFMGIGLVDPILRDRRQARRDPSQVSLLFTSYMAIAYISMLVTGVVSSRIGPKRTLLAGLVLIIVFAGLAGLSGSVGAVIGFRARLGPWVTPDRHRDYRQASSRGSVAQAIILSRGGLGLGIASGPFYRRPVGEQSWRGPFLRRLGADDDRAGRDRVVPPGDAAQGAITAGGPVPRPCATRRFLLLALVAIFYNLGFFTRSWRPGPSHCRPTASCRSADVLRLGRLLAPAPGVGGAGPPAVVRDAADAHRGARSLSRSTWPRWRSTPSTSRS